MPPSYKRDFAELIYDRQITFKLSILASLHLSILASLLILRGWGVVLFALLMDFRLSEDEKAVEESI